MALQSSGHAYWPDFNIQAGFTTFSATAGTAQINNTGYRYGFVFQAPRTGTITKIGTRISTCASAILSRLGLYTVDTSGNPTSTAYGGSAYTTFTPSANTYFEVTLGTSASATFGDWIALVVEFDSTAGDMFATVGAGTMAPISDSYYCRYVPTTWTKFSAPLVCHVYYSDGGGHWDNISSCPVTNVAASGTFNVGTAVTDEYALKFALPFSARIAGAWHYFGVAATADYEVNIYDATTPVATLSVDGDFTASAASLGLRKLFFASPYTATVGHTYRMGLRPTTSANMTYRNYTAFTAGAQEAFGVPQGTCQSTRVDQGSWSDQTTILPCIGLILDQLDDGVGGGGIGRQPKTRVIGV